MPLTLTKDPSTSQAGYVLAHTTTAFGAIAWMLFCGAFASLSGRFF
jgi:hypothetical protein